MPGDVHGDRWSFGGGGAFETVAGAASVTALIIGPEHAMLHASLMPSAERPPAGPGGPESARARNRDYLAAITFDDLSVTDDRGARHTLRTRSKSCSFSITEPARGPVDVSFELDPRPGRECAWVELRSLTGSATRLLPAIRASTRVGTAVPLPEGSAERDLSALAPRLIWLRLHGLRPADMESHCAPALARVAEAVRSGGLDSASELPDQFARLCASLTGGRPADGLPFGWSGMLADAEHSDGPPLLLDIATALPALDDTAVQVGTLVSQPGTWRLYLRASPAWTLFSADRKRAWPAMTVRAEDDRGGRYLSGPGSAALPTHRIGPGDGDGDSPGEVLLEFRPRLDPRARALTLTFAGRSEQAALELAW